MCFLVSFSLLLGGVGHGHGHEGVALGVDARGIAEVELASADGDLDDPVPPSAAGDFEDG